jgi:ketosteroid isomerase-like protein
MPNSNLSSAPGAVDWTVWVAINTRLQTYADAIDRGDVAGILALFTQDAVWDYAPGLTRQGHAKIGAFFDERFSVFAQTSHHVGPPVVRALPDSECFASTAYFIAAHVLRDEKTYTGYGRYIDIFQPVGDDWLIARRKVVGHVTQGIARTVNQLERVAR